MTRIGSVLLLLVGCSISTAPGPYSDQDGVQLPLFGDRICSDPMFGQVAMQCCTGSEDELGHDNCYAVGGTEQDRFACDAEFLACQAIWGVPEFSATVRYRAVRQFGHESFRRSVHRTRGPQH